MCVGGGGGGVHKPTLDWSPRYSHFFFIRRLKPSLGPVVIFSNANILKNKRIKIFHIKGIRCPLLISINIDIFDQGTEK